MTQKWLVCKHTWLYFLLQVDYQMLKHHTSAVAFGGKTLSKIEGQGQATPGLSPNQSPGKKSNSTRFFHISPRFPSRMDLSWTSPESFKRFPNASATMTFSQHRINSSDSSPPLPPCRSHPPLSAANVNIRAVVALAQLLFEILPGWETGNSWVAISAITSLVMDD